VNFFYNPYKQFNERIETLERSSQQDATALIDLGKRLYAIEQVVQNCASSATQQWLVKELTKTEQQMERLRKQVDEMEKRTTPPPGLEPEPKYVWQQTLRAVERHGGRMTTAKLAAEMGVRPNIASARLCHLVSRGLLRKTQRGEFFLPAGEGFGSHPSRILSARAINQRGRG
jgi:hypothetical protein